eukprot:14345735-Ditylum_brightwellii.AAC.1
MSGVTPNNNTDNSSKEEHVLQGQSKLTASGRRSFPFDHGPSFPFGRGEGMNKKNLTDEEKIHFRDKLYQIMTSSQD